jgi:hypothetical protein
LNSVKSIPINFGQNRIFEILVSGDNIVLPLYSRAQNLKSYEIIFKDGTRKSIEAFKNNIFYLLNDVLYTYDNDTGLLTYFNINDSEKKVSAKMGYKDVGKLLISEKCTILVCKSSIVIYYKKKVIVLDAKDYFMKLFKKKDILLIGSSVSINKESNKIVFYVRDSSANVNGPIIVYNLDTHKVERELDILGNVEYMGLALGFLDVLED